MPSLSTGLDYRLVAILFSDTYDRYHFRAPSNLSQDQVQKRLPNLSNMYKVCKKLRRFYKNEYIRDIIIFSLHITQKITQEI